MKVGYEKFFLLIFLLFFISFFKEMSLMTQMSDFKMNTFTQLYTKI